MAQQLKDRFDRQFYYLRLSITDSCNFRCQYCLPNGYQKTQPPNRFLSQQEIAHVVRAFAACGTTKVRITGGEPSMRRDVCDIIETIASTPGIKHVATTTNGYRLAQQANAWRSAGLTKLNVSVDSLDPRQFHQITGENRLDDVMRGIDAALKCGFSTVKVNTVLLKDTTLPQLPQFKQWVKDNPIQLRFIELMQTGDMNDYFQRFHQSGIEIRHQLILDGWQLKPRDITDGPAEVYHHPDYLGEIGLILPYDKGFCQQCNRLRISANGKLHLCLFGDDGVDLRHLLQTPQQQTELQELIQYNLHHKAEHHFLHQGSSGHTPHLASIGG
ncbi:GTP 3',8-cyclase MoaA [Thaumasiovibrio sp. DFM-14]|uniref:GTP 3',8-cyclase MoaA n=1 Tax=Thaumasiovibrio sp. DFM-14 TaxID=3384792 RepID=UPI0039A2CF3E